MTRLLISNGRVIDPGSGLDETLDVLIEDDRIAAVAPALKAAGAELLEASGLIVAPGFIDLRAQLREPGLEHAETIESGAQAAAAGGFTAVCCLPETSPFNDSPTVTSFIVERARRRAGVRVWPIGAATKNGEGEQLAEIGAMKRAGVVAIGDGERPVMDSGLMRRVLRYASSFGLTVIDHCEDLSLSTEGDIHEGPRCARLGLRGISASAESVLVARDMILSKETGARLHVGHLSTAAAVDIVRRGKAEGAPVSAEASAHHLALSVDDIADYDSNYKVRPPLRDPSDREALIRGIADGAIEAVVSDHSPHTGNVKMQEFERCPFGITALETAVGLAFETLVGSARIDLPRFIELFTVGPAKILQIDHEGVAEGASANLTLIDPASEWSYNAEESRSKSRNTPFDKRSFRGGPAATIVAGRIVWRRAAPASATGCSNVK